MSLSLTFWTFRCAQCMMSRENKGGRSMRETSTARIELSDAPVIKGAAVPRKKVKFVGVGMDLGNIVSSNRRVQGFKAPNAKSPKLGKIAFASSGNKRGTERSSGNKRGTEQKAKKPNNKRGTERSSGNKRGTEQTAKKPKPSPVVRPPHTTRFLGEISAGMKKGTCYTLRDLAKGLGLPPFIPSTKAELEMYLLSQSHAAKQKEPFDPTVFVEALGKAFDEHVARSGNNRLSPAPSPASSSAPKVYLPHSFLPFVHSLHSSFIFLPSFRLSFIPSLLPSFGH